jgi:hypothetical protein
LTQSEHHDQSTTDVDIDLTLGSNPHSTNAPLIIPPLESRSAAEFRESAARDVAMRILQIFAWSLTAAFLFVIALVMLAFHWRDSVLKEIVPVLGDFTRIVEIVGTIFSPLLAFILGYYFSESSKRR